MYYRVRFALMKIVDTPVSQTNYASIKEINNDTTFQ